jgi:hypothetical protein
MPARRRKDMDTQVLLERHSQLWETGQRSIRRTIISGLIFAVVVLFNVLEPYAETAPRRDALHDSEVKEEAMRYELQSLNSVTTELGAIDARLDEAPWTQRKNDLVRRFARGEVEDAQREADETIRGIAGEVRAEIAAPLKEVVAQAPALAGLASHPTEVSSAIDEWERRNIGNRWFETLSMKTATVDELDETMETIQREASRTVEVMRQAVEREHEQIATEQSELAEGIKTEQSEIQQVLDGIIPAWAKGLVPVELMAQIYPLVLVGIAIYLVGTAFVASRHYHGMADARGWSMEERSNPLLSSLWTLTYRGPTGTAITLLCYAVVLLGLWSCLVRGIEAGGVQSIPSSVQWLPHLVMFLASATAIITPLRRRGT